MLRTLGLLTRIFGRLGTVEWGTLLRDVDEWLGNDMAVDRAVATIVPTLAIGLVALRFTKLSFGTVGGLISGAMANPIALDFLNDSSDDNDPTVSCERVPAWHVCTCNHCSTTGCASAVARDPDTDED